MTRLKLKAPIIRENENSVIVYIRHEPLAKPEETVLDYLEKHLEITNTKARELTGIESESSMRQIFFRLRDQGLIEPVPGKRGAKSAWQKPGIQLKLPFTD